MSEMDSRGNKVADVIVDLKTDGDDDSGHRTDGMDDSGHRTDDNENNVDNTDDGPKRIKYEDLLSIEKLMDNLETIRCLENTWRQAKGSKNHCVFPEYKFTPNITDVKNLIRGLIKMKSEQKLSILEKEDK